MNNTTNNTIITTTRDNCPMSGSPSQTGLTALASLYIILTIVSFTGNILVISTVVINRRMRTVTNYLILNMAIADILLTVCNMPTTAASLLNRGHSWLVTGGIGEFFCKLVPFIQSLSVGSSVLNMTAIAIDRFFAVVFPLRRYVTFTVAYVMMGVAWSIAFAVSAPFFYAMNIIQPVKGGPLYCGETWNMVDLSKSTAPQDYTIVLFLFFYAIPLTIMSILYSVVIYKLWIRKVPGHRSQTNQQNADRSKKKVLRMLLVVVVVFAVCWLPIYISQFISFFGACQPSMAFSFSGFFLGHANSALNPLLYAVFNENYRKGFKDIFLCRCGKRRVIPGTLAVGFDNTYIDGKNLTKINVGSPMVRAHSCSKA